jgi:hypothetical protein
MLIIKFSFENKNQTTKSKRKIHKTNGSFFFLSKTDVNKSMLNA